ncbi:Autophagy-related protein 11 [Bienertia sinuspersici]
MGGMGAFWGTRMMEIVKKHDSGGLLWKRIKLTSTRKANAKKRLRRVWQCQVFVLYDVPSQVPGLESGPV